MQPSDPHVCPSTGHAPPGLQGLEAEPRLGRSREPPRGKDQAVLEPSAQPGRREPGSRRDRVLSLSPPREPGPPTNSARHSRAPASVPEGACGRAGWCDPPGSGERVGRSWARKLGRGREGSALRVPPLPGVGTVVGFLRRGRGWGFWRPEPSWHSLVPWLSTPPRSPPLLPSPAHLTEPSPYRARLFIRLAFLSPFGQL